MSMAVHGGARDSAQVRAFCCPRAVPIDRERMPMPKKTLTDRTLKSLPAALPGKRVLVYDTEIPGFGVRVTDKRVRTFVLVARYPASGKAGGYVASPRAIGVYPDTTLEEARAKAREWRRLLRNHVDPAAAEENARR